MTQSLALIVAAIVALVVMGCAALVTALGYPPEAMRREPPTGIEASALAPGAEAPDFTLPSTLLKEFSLSRSLAAGPTVLVFYRGHW